MPSPTPQPNPITFADIRRHLAGCEAWLQAAEVSGFTREYIEGAIPEYVRRFERETLFRINAVQVVSVPDGTFAEIGDLYDKTGQYEVYEEAAYPYYRDRGDKYLQTQLNLYPVREVQRCRLTLDTGNVVFTFPREWYKVNRRTGQFSLLPVSGSALSTAGWTSWASVEFGFGNTEYAPQVLAFDYIAGMPDGWASNGTREWADLKRALAEWGAYCVLGDISEAFDAGVAGKSLGDGMGLSQAMQYSRFGPRMSMLYNNAMTFMTRLKEQETPVLMTAT